MGSHAAVEVTPERIMQFAWAYAPTFILEAAIRHRVFDFLDERPKTVEEVSAAAAVSVRGLRSIMNALVGLELLAKEADGLYSLTPESSRFLVSSKPGFLGGMLRHTSSQLVPKWLELDEIVRTGRPAKAVNHQDIGEDFFRQFVADIFPMSYPSAQALANELRLAGAAGPVSVLDLAAGSGVWSIALAQNSPHVRVTAVDWPGVLTATKTMVSRFGLLDRYRFVAGDLHSAEFGMDYDIATLGHILHSEGEELSRALLRKTWEALAPGGTIAIGEILVDEHRRESVLGLIFAVNMLVNTECGDTFTFREISGWLRDAGFENPRTLEVPGPSPLILAGKPR